MLQNLFRFFPPPEFLHMSHAGLSISDKHIRYMKFGRKGTRLYIEKYLEKKLPPQVIENGVVASPAEFTQLLTELKKETGVTYVALALPEEKGYLFTAKIPKVDNSEIRGAIEFKMEENVPVPASELVFDYQIIEAERADNRLAIAVSAIPTAILNGYLSCFAEAGITLVSVGIESQALAQSVISPLQKEAVLVVYIHSSKVGMYVACNRIVHFSSTLAVPVDEAEIQAFLSHEIVKLYAYWHTLKDNAGRDDRKINKIYICGLALDSGALSYVSSHTSTTVDLGNVWRNVFSLDHEVPELSFADSLRFGSAIGMALPEHITI